MDELLNKREINRPFTATTQNPAPDTEKFPDTFDLEPKPRVSMFSPPIEVTEVQSTNKSANITQDSKIEEGLKLVQQVIRMPADKRQ